MQHADKIVYDIFFNFISTGWLVTLDNVSEKVLMDLVILADYFCVPKLAEICSNELTSMINTENVTQFLSFSLQFRNLSNLSLSCCDFWIKHQTLKMDVAHIQSEILTKFEKSQKISQNLMRIYQRIKFDLVQTVIESDKVVTKPTFKKGNSNSEMEKENF